MRSSCSKSTPEEYLDFLKERNIDYIVAGVKHVDLKEAMEKLNLEYKINSIRVDSGGILNAVLLNEGLANEIHVLIHLELVGDVNKDSIFISKDLNPLNNPIKLKLAHIDKLNDDMVWIKYDIIG
ncbi:MULTISPECIES: dihydrofolate reductase family protein [Methanobacterium]|uniref:dihydrofolate reductase family protein n=1 Tax=Methanobacterium TaxID=2160 RepID=UPI00159F1AE0|nr:MULTISPECIES: dihydrofolate reductase family protein [Methanobacterium]